RQGLSHRVEIETKSLILRSDLYVQLLWVTISTLDLQVVRRFTCLKQHFCSRPLENVSYEFEGLYFRE
ncbi:hypothetical protein LZN24_33970, partial [Pseudomonas aeruginosa]|nr:hypothetical protein [Pseudomonas aeruginosa]